MRGGFTLIELLVVIAFLAGLLAALSKEKETGCRIACVHRRAEPHSATAKNSGGMAFAFTTFKLRRETLTAGQLDER